jgi:hypothetical protein
MIRSESTIGDAGKSSSSSSNAAVSAASINKPIEKCPGKGHRKLSQLELEKRKYILFLNTINSIFFMYVLL